MIGDDNLLGLVKATRVYRIIPTLMILLICSSFAGELTREIFLFGMVLVLCYSVAGIQNAISDKDWKISRHYKIAIVFLLMLAFFVSLFNKIILVAFFVFIVSGIIYNKFSRFILFGDTTLMSFTHFVLPCIFSGLLLNLDKCLIIKLSIFLFAVAWLIFPSKNLKESEKDKKLGYKTLNTVFRRGEIVCLLFLVFSLVPLTFVYFLFEMSYVYFLFIGIILILQILVILCVLENKNEVALKIGRMILIVSLFGFLISISDNILILFSAGILSFFYFLSLIVNIFWGKNA